MHSSMRCTTCRRACGCPASARARRRRPWSSSESAPTRCATRRWRPTCPAGTSGPWPSPGSTRSTARPSTGTTRRPRVSRSPSTPRSRSSRKPEVKSYKGLDGVRIPPEVPREAVDSELERLRLTVAELMPVERGAEEGDFAVIDFDGSIDGSRVRGRQGLRLRRRAGRRPAAARPRAGHPGNEGGRRARRHRCVPGRLPAENLAGKAAQFHVTAEGGQGAAAARARRRVREERQRVRHARRAGGRHHQQPPGPRRRPSPTSCSARPCSPRCGRELATPLPEAIVRSRMSEMARNLIDDLARRGMSTEQFLAITGQTSERPGQRAAAAGRGVRGPRPRPRGGGRRRADRGRRREVEDWIREQAESRPRRTPTRPSSG